MSEPNESLSLWLDNLYNDQVGLRLRLRACLHSETSPFQRIAVYDSDAFGKVLTLGDTITLSDADSAIYAEAIVHPALVSHPDPQRVLVLGGGDGVVAREVLRHSSVREVVVVEIDQRVQELTSDFFPATAEAWDDARCHLIIDDAHRYLAEDDADPFDCVLVDGVELHDDSSAPFHHRPLIELLAERLATDGILASPLGSPRFAGPTCQTALRKLRQILPRCHPLLAPTPGLFGGLMAAVCASREHAPTLDVADAPWHADLSWWSPVMQQAAFALPPVLGKALGG